MDPHGVNLTKRYVSSFAETELFNPHETSDGGTIELVDYMGGDPVIERAATAGRGRNIFPENPHLSDFMHYLKDNGIINPFKFTQLKISIQAPIDVALDLVYSQACSVNEYSARYSELLETANIPSSQDILQDVNDEERAERIHEILSDNRSESFQDYEKLLSMDMARELARAVIGTNNHTRFYWKIDLPSLAGFVEQQRNLSMEKGRLSDEYVERVAKLARCVAPDAWDALMSKTRYTTSLTFPNDDEVVDGPLSQAQWVPAETRRPVVPALEDILFVQQGLLDHGGFQVTSYMGDVEGMAQAARTSYQKGTKQLVDDARLVQSLIRDLHTSPIEMAELAIESKSPVFSDPRQAGRHRTGDWHGFMGYVPKGSKFYVPPDEELKKQDRVNRQGRGKDLDLTDKQKALEIERERYAEQLSAAEELRELGAPEEYIRSMKGVGFYTITSRTCDLHNWGGFLILRLDPHAQKEVRELAQLVDQAYHLQAPEAHEALHMYHIDGVRFGTKETALLNKWISDGVLNGEFDLDNVENYKGAGLVVKGKLGREGQAFQKKMKKILS